MRATDGGNSPSGVGLLSRNGFCLSGKANLHPLAFYTINLTSPSAGSQAYLVRCTIPSRAKLEANQPSPVLPVVSAYQLVTGPAQATDHLCRRQASAQLRPERRKRQDLSAGLPTRPTRALAFLSRVLVTLLYGPTARVRAAQERLRCPQHACAGCQR